MKRQINTCWALPVWVILGIHHLALAQGTHVAMPYNNGPLSVTLAPPADCSYSFSDNGINGDYSAQSGPGSVVTFWPSSPGNKVVVQFISFHTETGFDALFVYDGPNTAAPQISSGAAALQGLPNPFSGGAGGWQGSSAPYNVAPNTVRASASNSSGALTFAFDSDLTVEKEGWTAIVSEVPGNLCSLQAPGALSVNAPAGVCAATIQTAPPSISPGACALALELRYRLNDGPAVTLPAPAPPTVVIPDVPVGLNVVTWQLVAPCGGGLAASVAQLVTVKDQTPPVLTVPANVTLSLAAGQCAAAYDYTVSAADNCTFTPAARVDHPVDFDNGAAGVMFDVKNLGTQPLLITEFGPVLDPGTWPVEVYVTTAATTWQGVENDPAAWTPAGTRSVASAGAGAGTPLTDFKILLAPGESRGVYITAKTGAPVRCTGVGGGIQRQFDDGSLRVSASPGAAVGYPFSQTYYYRAYNGYVKYALTHTTPEQTAGLPSGAEFPAGATVNVFKCTDQAGNTATASFTVTVLPFSGATNTLVCASQVNASLGPGCATILGADDILLGGPYKCFDAYVVEVDKIPPYNDGPWVPAVLGSADIGKTYGVRVSDPTANNFCMGSVLVEDKIPPVITGDTIDLPCNFNASPTYSAAAAMSRTFMPAGSLPAKVLDFQTVDLSIPADAPNDAKVEDVDLLLHVNGDVFEKNLRIELISPDGTTAVLWNQAGGCNGPLWLRFDDEGNTATDCAQFTGNQRTRIPFNTGSMSAFDGKSLQGTWKLRIRDLNGFGDVATVTDVRLIVRYGSMLSAGFPSDLVYPGQISQIAPASFVVSAPLLDGCSNVTLNYSDEVISKPCSTGLSTVINRTWTARDGSNNQGTFMQVIRMLRASLEDLVLPPNYNETDAPAFECASTYPTPAWIESQGKQGTPRVFGQSTSCSINWSFTDAVVQVCPGAYTINRSWLILDACSNQSVQSVQVIKVMDRGAPAINCPANLTVSTELYNCCSTVNLPDVVVEDGCSYMTNPSGKVVVFNQYSGDTTQVMNVGGTLSNFPGNNLADPDTMVIFGNTACLPVGTHHVYYKAEDACGNSAACSFKVTVRDYTSPVAVGHSLTNVGLNADDVNDCYEPDANGVRFAGVATVAASVFDQGSYDNCNFVKVTVRRQPPYSACISSLNSVNGAPPCSDNFTDPKSEYARAVGESDSIKFYCCEAGTTQTLILRCYQLDALGNLSVGPTGNPIFNETLVKVEVQDKLSPGCQAPPDVTVACENFDPTLISYGLPELLDNCCLDTTKTYKGKSGVTQVTNYAQFDTVCNRGALVRTFTVYDCQGQTSQCTQQIVVEQEIDYAIRFPDDVIVSFCDSSGVYGEPIIYGEACELMAVSFQDVLYTVVSDACYEIERTWRVKDLCNSLPGSGCITVPNPTPQAILSSPQNLTGPIVSPPGTPAPWTASVTKVFPNDPQATNYSSFWNPTVSCYEYKQIIKVIDKQAPLPSDAPDSTVTMDDFTLNANDLWNETYWNDKNISGSHDLGEGPSDLSLVATDLCSGANISLRYLLFLDLNADGNMETVVNSADLPGFNTVRFGNANNPNYLGGEARAFDQRPVPASQKYGFSLETKVIGNQKKASVCWNTQQDPNTYFVPELPYGQHKIKWIISDGCGNEAYYEHAFEVKDSKAPTVVCHDGLSVNLMPAGMIQMWATDFLKYAVDNYTPPTPTTAVPTLLQYAIRKVGQGTGFPAQTAVTFTCDEVGPQEVELWAKDLAGNAGYCTATIEIQDNGKFCGSDNVIIAGSLKTELDEGVAGAGVHLQVIPPNSTAFDFMAVTDTAGVYIFPNSAPLGSAYTVTPALDDNPLNGVSTFDLVLISKHILGLEPLPNPYRMIAADANRSSSITTFDIVEIRKLILGIYTELPANTSWRFVDKNFVFPNTGNPFQTPFPESISATNVQASQLANDFVAIKTGDVNATALPNSFSAGPDDRGAGTLFFDVADRAVNAGEEFTVTFRASEKVPGWQFTLNLAGLETLRAEASRGITPGNFGVFADALTVSVNDADVPEFAVTFRALKAGKLSEMLGISSRITRAEAYKVMEGNYGNYGNYGNFHNYSNYLLDIALRFNSPAGQTVSAVGFELYQNQPNPFDNRTLIGFHLPEADEATLTVYDETGRVIVSRQGRFAQGHNAFVLDRRDFPAADAPGVWWYSIATPRWQAAKKMIRLR